MNTLLNLPVWQKNHIDVCLEKNLFEGKKVLEIGGCIPYEVVKSLNVESWTCIDPAYLHDIICSDDYKLIKASVLDYGDDEQFDFIMATNSFEHVLGLDKGIENSYRILKKGGYLSALLGPIWSCYKGNHVDYIDENNQKINFNNILLPDWAHLIYTKEEVKSILSENYTANTAEYISDWIFHTNFLNRLFYDDYKKIIESSTFNIVEFRDWHTSKFPSDKVQNFLETKYNKKNFSTVSIKMLLQK